MGSKSIEESNGFVLLVDDEEILTAQKIVSEKFGILIEPSSAAAFAAYKKNVIDDVLLLFTGNGLKDISSLAKWNKQPEVHSNNSIKEKYF